MSNPMPPSGFPQNQPPSGSVPPPAMPAYAPGMPGGITNVNTGMPYTTLPARRGGMNWIWRIVVGIVGVIAIIGGLEQIFGHGHNVDYGKDNIRYSHDATRGDADTLANSLKARGIFGNANGATVLLDKVKDAITLTFVVDWDKVNNPDSLKSYRIVGPMVAAPLGGRYITTKLADSNLNEKSTLDPLATMAGAHYMSFGKDDVVYFHDVTEADAKAFGKALQDVKYFEGKGVSAVLDKNKDGYIAGFVVQNDKATPESMHEFETFVPGVIKSVGGRLAQIQLLDDELNVKQKVDVPTGESMLRNMPAL